MSLRAEPLPASRFLPCPLRAQRAHTFHPCLPPAWAFVRVCRAASSSDWEGMVSLNRTSMGQEFFKYLDLRIR